MVKPAHVKLDSSQRYAFIQGTSGKPITYVRVEDIYQSLRRCGVKYHELVNDEIDAKLELMQELKENGW